MQNSEEVTPKLNSHVMLAHAEGTITPVQRGNFSPSGRAQVTPVHVGLAGTTPSSIAAAANRERVESKIDYEFLSKPGSGGSHEPDVIGKGRFAKVFRAWQRSGGKELRQVAIKILHNTASTTDQNLFDREIELLKEQSPVSGPHVVNVLDIIHLGPMVMCGCGHVYHPLCPSCGKHLLQKKEADEYPALECPSRECRYEVSAMNVEMHYKKLTSPLTKSCCKDGPHASEGTIINFVHRQAVIMELEETRLDEVAKKRSAYFKERWQQFRSTIGKTSSHLTYGRAKKDQDDIRLKQAAALDKVMLMVQVAEAVAWLHQDQQIIHKDLTPDNVMVNFNDTGSTPSPAQREQPIRFDELVKDLVSYPKFSVKIIDFGLADRKELTRKWYEDKDIINAGMDKAPYFSPEAKQRLQLLNFPLSIDPELKRFIIPHELKNSINGVQKGDTLTFQWDREHIHELTVKRIEPAPNGQGQHYAYFDGQPPEPKQQQGIQMVLPLGEPHDIYSVGALFYYILTGDHLLVNNLSGFVNVLQTHPCELTAPALLRRHGDSYIVHRDAIPVPDLQWRDRIMELILRAMVRGRPHSFNKSRSERGPDPARALLWATKSIYHGMQQQILAEPRLRSMRRSAIPAAVAALLLCMVGSYAAAKYQAGSRHTLAAGAEYTPAPVSGLSPASSFPTKNKPPESAALLEERPLGTTPPTKGPKTTTKGSPAPR